MKGRYICTRGLVCLLVLVNSSALSAAFDPGCAWNPSPANYETDVHFIGGLTLSWSPGDWAATGEPNGHYVFLGTVFNDVNTAGIGTAGTNSPVFIGRRDVNNITIAEANFVPNRTYYWRVDEINDPCNHKGNVWEFRTVNEKARDPSPEDGGRLKMPLELTWTPGDWSPNEHRVYFGTSYGVVNAANTGTPLIYRGTASTPSYSLLNLYPDVTLELNKTYYWRVDEKGMTGTYTIAGKSIWSFNTGDLILIEDFQEYFNTEELNDVWLEGVPVCSGQAGTGKVTLIREGASDRYMQFTYDKTGAGGRYFSEVAYPFSSRADFTGGWVLSPVPDTLELMYRGYYSNSADPVYDRMYVAIEDTNGNVSVTLHPDPEAQKEVYWTMWRPYYSELLADNPSVDINSVATLYLGAGDRCNMFDFGGGDGNIMFDDIGLSWWGPWCWPPAGPIADFDDNCIVNIYDLEILAGEWLDICEWVWPPYPAVEPCEPPILWYKFDETTGTAVTDYGTGDANDYTGQVINYSATLTWDPDGDCNGNGCIYLPNGQESYVEAMTSGNPLWWIENPDSNGVTFSIWINADLTANWGSWSGLFGAWDLSVPVETIEVVCPSPWPPAYQDGPICYLCKRQPGDGAYAETDTVSLADFGGRWNNWIFIKDNASTPQEMRIYHNGILVADINANDDADVAGPLTQANIGSLRIGTRGGNWGMWSGWLDDFRIYDYALSEGEVLWIATTHCPIYHLEPVCISNIKPSPPEELERVNFEDLALMCDEWMTEKLWYGPIGPLE